MKSKIRILSVLLAVVMTASMFAACKSGGSGSSESGTGSTGGNSGKVEEISWYTWGKQPNQPDEVIAALNEKSAKDIGVKVNFKWQTPTDEALRSALSAGDKDIDLAFACGWWADYVGSAQKNYFMDLTTILPEKAPELYKLIPDVLWQGIKVNDKIYGMPHWKDTAGIQFWIARKEILEAAGATEDFAQAGLACSTLTPTLEKIKAWHDADPENNKYSEGNTAPINFNKAGLNGHNTNWDEFQADLRVGVKLDGKSTTVQSYFTDPDYIADLKTLKDWADRGLSNGLVALQVEQEAELTTVGTAQGWDGAQFTAWGGDVKGYETVIQKKAGPNLTSGYVQGAATVIGANSKKADAALKYFEYVNTNKDFRNMLNYGIEDKNWEKTDKETVKILTGQDWAPGGFALGNFQLLYPTYECPADMYTKVCETVNEATPSQLLGFIPNTEKIANEITACVATMKEYQEMLTCGAVKDVDATVAELLAKLDKQGYNKIIAEYQAQADAFRANKK